MLPPLLVVDVNLEDYTEVISCRNAESLARQVFFKFPPRHNSIPSPRCFVTATSEFTFLPRLDMQDKSVRTHAGLAV
jgi:hypothetical protein